RQKKEQEAELIFRSLHPHYRIAELTPFLPDHIRDDILSHYRWTNMGLSQLLSRPNSVAARERAMEVEDFFQSSPDQRQLTRFHLFRAYARAGLRNKAEATAQVLFKDAPGPNRL